MQFDCTSPVAGKINHVYTCSILRKLGCPCEIDVHSGAQDVTDGTCSHQETLPEAAVTATSAKGVWVIKWGFQLNLLQKGSLLFYQRHVALKYCQNLKHQLSWLILQSNAFIMKPLVVSGLSFALCQPKRSTNVAGRKEPCWFCEVYKDLLSSNAHSVDGSWPSQFQWSINSASLFCCRQAPWCREIFISLEKNIHRGLKA